MHLLKRMVYVGFGVLLALAVITGGVMAFAQSGDEAVAQSDGDDAETEDEAQDEDGLRPSRRVPRLRGRPGAWSGDRGELLAEALGISVEELEAAYEEVRAAAIEQALEAGLISEEQAERLLEGSARFGRGLPGFLADKDERLAGALDISVEELQEARDEVRVARLEALVEAGVLTQEQADLMAAREAVQGYIDQEGLAETIQDAYEEAVEAALEAGDITEEQAEQLQETLPAFGPFGFGRGGHHHGPHFRSGPGGGAFVPGTGAPAVDTGLDA
jgi:hypothetical protein